MRKIIYIMILSLFTVSVYAAGSDSGSEESMSSVFSDAKKLVKRIRQT